MNPSSRTAQRPLGSYPRRLISRVFPPGGLTWAWRSRAGAAGSDSGMTTAEYAVGTVAACAFGGILYKVVTSSEVISLLTGIVRRALSLPM